MGIPFDRDTASKLLKNKHISPATFARMFPDTQRLADGGFTGPPNPALDDQPPPPAAEPPAAEAPAEVPGEVDPATVAPSASLAPSAGDWAAYSAAMSGQPAPAGSAPPPAAAAPSSAAAPGDPGANGGAVRLASDVAGQAGGAGVLPQGFPGVFAPDTRGIDMQEQALRDAAKAGQAKAAETTAQYERMQVDNQNRLEANQAAETARQTKLDESFKKLQDAQADFAQQKVDPNRFWANKDTGDKVLAGIGLFLGAFSQSGSNPAVQVITQAINRDIDAQKANIDVKGQAVRNQQGIYGDMFARFKDQRAASEATRIAYLDNAQMKIQQISAKYAGPEIKAKADQAIGQLEQEKANARQQFQAAILARMPVGPDANPEWLDKDRRERFVPGMGLAPTPKDAETMKDVMTSANQARTSLNALVKINSTDMKSLSPAMRANAEAQVASLIGPLRGVLFGAGAKLNETEIGIIDGVAKNPTSFFSLDSANKASLQALLQKVDDGVRARAQALGMKTTADRLGFTQAAK